MYNHILQIETVGPQGDKLIWVLLIMVAIALMAYFFVRKSSFNLPSFKSKVIVKAEKNKIYHPTVIHLKIENRKKKAIVIEHPVVRFRRGRNTKAFKIRAVNARSIYPLYLEANKTHELAVALEPFYEYDPKLKKFSRLRIEFIYDKEIQKISSYLILKSTLFRSAR